MIVFIMFASIIFCIVFMLLIKLISYLMRVHKAKMILLRNKLLEIYNKQNTKFEIRHTEEFIKELEDILYKGI